MMKRLSLVFAVMLVFVTIPITIAQDIGDASVLVETGAVITWPYPVSEIWDVVPIIGTANVPNMAYYYIEAIPLNDQMAIPTDAPWLPLTAGITEPVVNDVLATIDTTDGADGLYAIRLTINTNDGQQYIDVVSPVRLHNERYQIEVDYIRSQIENGVDPIQPPIEPPTGPENPTPRVVTNPDLRAVNVRRCDIVDNDRCPINGFLREGEEGLVQAVSANGTGWFQITLPAGNGGWVSPTVVTPLGDFNGVPVVAPPVPLNPPPPPVVVVPPPNPVPSSTVTINGMAIQGNGAVCNETFNVNVNIANVGNTNSNAGTVTLQDVHINTGSITFTGSGNYPMLSPGANFVVVIPVRTSVWYNEQHELRAFTNGKQFNIRYTLGQGACGQPTNPPPRPAPELPPIRTFEPGECTVNAQPNAPLFNQPRGRQIGQIGPEGATFNVLTATRINGQTWFELQGEMDNPGGWIRNRDAPFNQDVCQL